MLPGLPDQVRRKVLFNPVMEILTGRYDCISYNKDFVVKTADGVSIMELNIFEVHCKIVEVCQRNTQINPQRDGSLIIEVPLPYKSDYLHAIRDIHRAQVPCFSMGVEQGA